MTKCLMCGTEFVPSKFNTTIQRYCSFACRYRNWASKNLKAIQTHRKSWKKRNWDKVLTSQRQQAKKKARQNWVEKDCKECGKSFLPDIRHKGQQIYCSTKCREKCNRKWENLTEYRKTKKRHDVVERKHRVRANGGRFTLQEWELMKKDYNFTCPICRRNEPDIKLVRDHIFPIVKGGRHCKENIQPLCISCNCRKHDKIDSVPCIRHTVIENFTLKMSVVDMNLQVVSPTIQPAPFGD